MPFPGKYGPPPGHSYKPYRPHGPKPYPIYEKPEFEDISGPGGIIEHEVPPPFLDGGSHKVHTDKSTVVVNTQGKFRTTELLTFKKKNRTKTQLHFLVRWFRCWRTTTCPSSLPPRLGFRCFWRHRHSYGTEAFGRRTSCHCRKASTHLRSRSNFRSHSWSRTRLWTESCTNLRIGWYQWIWWILQRNLRRTSRHVRKWFGWQLPRSRSLLQEAVER